jgi:hypothetical protein
MEKDSGKTSSELRVDGGAAANDLLMQFQADLLGVPVVRPRVLETTALRGLPRRPRDRRLVEPRTNRQTMESGEALRAADETRRSGAENGRVEAGAGEGEGVGEGVAEIHRLHCLLSTYSVEKLACSINRTVAQKTDLLGLPTIDDYCFVDSLRPPKFVRKVHAKSFSTE